MFKWDLSPVFPGLKTGMRVQIRMYRTNGTVPIITGTGLMYQVCVCNTLNRMKLQLQTFHRIKN